MNLALWKKVNEKLSIVDIISKHIVLKKRGKNFWGLCPFHDDNHPSLSISPEKKVFSCFSCNTSGNAIKFVAKYTNTSQEKVLFELADSLGIKYTRDIERPFYKPEEKKIIEVLEEATNFFQNQLMSPLCKKAYNELRKRHLSQKQIEKYKIGYAIGSTVISFLLKKYSKTDLICAGIVNEKMIPRFQNRLIFPLCNKNGDVVGFSGRSLERNSLAKYYNSPANLLFNKSKLLYNYFRSKDIVQETNEVVVTEGFFDVMALETAGFKNVVAVMGSNFTLQHSYLLRNKKIMLMFDQDNAGLKACIGALKILLSHSQKVYVIQGIKNLDPAEILEKHGVSTLKKLVSETTDGFICFYDFYRSKTDVSKPEALNNLFKQVLPFVPFTNNLMQEIYAGKISKDLNVPHDIILKKIQEAQSYNLNTQQFKKLTNPDKKKKIFSLYEATQRVKKTRFAVDIKRLKDLLLKNPDLSIFFKNYSKTFVAKEVENEINDFILKNQETITKCTSSKTSTSITKNITFFYFLDIMNRTSLCKYEELRSYWQSQLKKNIAQEKYFLIKKIQERITVLDYKIRYLNGEYEK